MHDGSHLESLSTDPVGDIMAYRIEADGDDDCVDFRPARQQGFAPPRHRMPQHFLTGARMIIENTGHTQAIAALYGINDNLAMPPGPKYRNSLRLLRHIPFRFPTLTLTLPVRRTTKFLGRSMAYLRYTRAAEDPLHRHDQNFEVEPERAVIHVPHVERELFLP